ncbi:MAG: magnesium transporter [Candidatus Aenigmarchaeota archaeon]|nr:magnesium transporter [Candidatus Aenigmarchaeota archaeon]
MSYLDVREIFEESIPVLTLTAAISIFSGFFLNNNEEVLKFLPGLLIIIPSFIAINGNISSVMTSRLSSALHMGLIKPDFRRTSLLMRNFYSMIFISLVSFPVLGLIAGGLNVLFGGGAECMLAFLLITFAAGMTTALVLIFVSMLFSYLTYRRGLDPDNVVIPLLTTIGDLVGISVLLIVTGLVI